MVVRPLVLTLICTNTFSTSLRTYFNNKRKERVQNYTGSISIINLGGLFVSLYLRVASETTEPILKDIDSGMLQLEELEQKGVSDSY